MRLAIPTERYCETNAHFYSNQINLNIFSLALDFGQGARGSLFRSRLAMFGEFTKTCKVSGSTSLISPM